MVTPAGGWKYPLLDTNDVRSGIYMIGPQQATALVERIVKNRPFSRASCEERTANILDGTWRLTTDAIGVDSNGNVINGEHRLRAVIAAGKAVPFLVLTNLQPDTFSVLDCGRPRGGNDALAIAGFKNYNTISAMARIEVVATTRPIPKRVPPHEILAQAQKMDGISDIAAAVSSSGAYLRGWCPTSALGWVSWHASLVRPDLWRAWHDGVVTGVSLSDDDARFVIRRRLQLDGSHNGIKYSTRGNQSKVCNLLWKSWEYFRSGRHVSVIKLAPEKLESELWDEIVWR